MASSPQNQVRVSNSTATDVYLRGRSLFIARVIWFGVVIFNFILFAMNLLRPLFGGKIFACPLTFTCPYDEATLLALRHAGISLASYDTYVTITGLVYGLIFVGIGVLLFWRKSDHLVSLLASFAFLFIGFSGIIVDSSTLPPVLQVCVGIFQENFQSLCLGLFLVTFPDGRFVPRWAWLVGCTLLIQAMLFELPAPLGILSWPPVFTVTELILAYSCPIAIQVYRYARVSSPAQRQQTRWVIFGLVLALLLLFIGFFSGGFFPAESIFQLASGPLSSLGFLCLPLSISVAILRYRLWDIDVIINRTLVYGSLTAMLALVYVALIFSLQFLTRGLTGDAGDSPIVIVGSTLAIAALFQPLRKRTQNIIDRRFYRQKYDAARALQAFNAALRQEVDLAHLCERIAGVVQETVQPMHVSLWLFQPERGARTSTDKEKAG
jgi:hypothetical protein